MKMRRATLRPCFCGINWIHLQNLRKETIPPRAGTFYSVINQYPPCCMQSLGQRILEYNQAQEIMKLL